MECGEMQTECIKEALTVEEAVDAALEELGVQQDAVDFEVLEEPTSRRFGLGTERNASVRVWIRPSYIADLERSDDPGEAEETLPAELQAAVDDDLSEEDLDKVADTAVTALQTILTLFGVEVGSIDEYEGDEGEIILDVVGGDLALLIGRHGRTLDALQALVSAITSRELGFRHPIVVDVEGYRHRRRQKIEDIAKRAAEKASRQHAEVRLRPMTAYERRVVHVVLRDDRRVATGSEGEDPFRMVVVRPR
jgi:spoIIIJ-associated protein